MNHLQSRKQLLIAESEINRVHLVQEWHALSDEVGAVADKAKSFNTMTATIFSLVAAVGSFTNGPAAATAQSSWFQKITGGVKLATTIWQMFRPQDPGTEKR